MYDGVSNPLYVFLGFLIVVLASRNIGWGFRSVGLPQISGFLFAGIMVGPYVLGFVDKESLEYFHVVDSFALPFIAFVAGSELELNTLRHRLAGILSILALIILIVFPLGAIAFFAMSNHIPFMKDMPFLELLGVAILGGSILITISPAGVIAVIKELRAKGPFSQTVLGVTVLMDSVAILLFAICL